MPGKTHKRVAVLGAGVIGLTSAYYLAKAGHSVTILETADRVAMGASHANAAQLSYSFTNALGNPALLKKLPALALGTDPAIRIRGGPKAPLARWGLRFLAQCTAQRAINNTLAALAITMRSKTLTENIISELSLQCSFRQAGKLVLLSSAQALESATRACLEKNAHGCDVHVISMSEACDIEPSLAQMAGNYSGAVYSSDDQVADCRQFCQALSAWLIANTDTRLMFNTTVKSFASPTAAGVTILTAGEPLLADAAVVCTGAHSTALMATAGIRLPVYPVRGYSVTLPAGDSAPVTSLTDHARRVVLSRLDQSVRITGFADLVGFDTSRDAGRIATLLDITRQIAPRAADYESGNRYAWGGFRPMTPSGLPLIGPSTLPRVYLNTGHGMLGWTMACASGHDVARQISQDLNH